MLETALTLFATPVTWLEVVAFALALGGVACTLYEVHWGWPLAIVSSVLYAWLFFVSRLYGDVAVQGYFVFTSGWGWWQWLFGHRAPSCGPLPQGGEADGGGPLRVAALGARRRGAVAALWLLAWPSTGLFLAHFTDTDVPYFDALPTAGSFIGQALLALKYVENWPVWLIVNVVSVALYAYKSLPLTALLYVVFAALSAAGWRRWQRRLDTRVAGA
jgi:nicotinamide mononucleotide transporter